ncbi:MAG: 2-keto-4-pentenoate hydratase [Alphaproteobacteria bacterium]
MADTRGIADRIVDAYRTGTPIAPIRGEISGAGPAYAIQQQTIARWTKAGRRIVGRKIGLTSKAVQSQLGVNEPDYGVIFGDTVLPDGAVAAAGSVMQPRVEAEIAFVLARDLVGQKITPEQVIAATDFVRPALEICGSRIAQWDIKIEDTIADNASAGLVVLGPHRETPDLARLAAVGMVMHKNGEPVAQGRGDACLGNPAIAVAWLAETLTRLGEGLRAGDLVMSGALAKMVAAEPGSRFTAEFEGMGKVSIAFAT